MDELQLLRDLGQDSPLPAAKDIEPARERLLATARAEQAALPRRRFRRRLALASGLGIAAAVAAVVVISPLGQAPTADATPQQVLHRAAEHLRAVPAANVRPDRFVYTRSATETGPIERWMSVDGTRDSLIVRDGKRHVSTGCRSGRQVVTDANVNGKFPDRTITEPCEPFPAVDLSLPADADKIHARITERYGDDVNAKAKEVLHLIDVSTGRPDVRAAIFEAASRIPGLTLVEDAKDAAGRTGLGISWSADGKSGLLIFDEETYAYLGSPGDAVLETAVVDEAGQRP